MYRQLGPVSSVSRNWCGNGLLGGYDPQFLCFKVLHLYKAFLITIRSIKLKCSGSTHVTRLRPSTLLLIAFLCLLTFIAHYPGQASVDTIIQLQDGISGRYDSNQPPPFSWLIACLALPGVLVLNLTLFGCAVVALMSHSNASTASKNTAILLLFCFPIVFLYNGIVWKDVLFANGALLSLIALPRPDTRSRWLSLVASAAIMSLAVSVRQQGILAAAVAIAYLLLVPHIFPDRLNRIKALLLWTLVFVTLSKLTEVLVALHGDVSHTVSVEGPLYQLSTFDLGGVAAVNRDLHFPALESVAHEVAVEHQPTRERVLAALKGYSSKGQDSMGESIAASGAWFPQEALYLDWHSRIIEYPWDYAAHRLHFLSWLFGFKDIYQCTPFVYGISAEPSHMIREIGIEPGISWRAEQIGILGLNTIFLFRPYFYLTVSIVTTGLLMYGGWQRHLNMIVIQIAGLAYAASYTVIGIACDFRYTYFSTVVALVGLVYIATSLQTLAPPENRIKNESSGK